MHRVDVFLFSNWILKSKIMNFERSSSTTNFNYISPASFSSAVALAVTVCENQWEQSIHLDKLCCRQNFYKLNCIYKLFPLSNYLLEETK